MKKLTTLLLVVLIASFALSACGSSEPAPAAAENAAEAAPAANNESAAAAEPGSATESMEYFSTEYPDATNTRNQLGYGTILLTSSDLPISAEQAKAMLPFWQAMLALTNDASSAPEEISALQTQIIASFTPEQLAYISEAQITNAMLTEYYTSLGIEVPTPSADTTRVPGQGKNMTDEEKAARRATAEASGEMPGSGSGQATKNVLFEKVIETLQALAN